MKKDILRNDFAGNMKLLQVSRYFTCCAAAAAAAVYCSIVISIIELDSNRGVTLNQPIIELHTIYGSCHLAFCLQFFTGARAKQIV